MKTENLSTLKIHKLSKEQYDRELAAGRIDETALYLTPDSAEDVMADVQAQIDSLSSEIANLKAVSISVISGESEPDSTLGEDGDVYLVTG